MRGHPHALMRGECAPVRFARQVGAMPPAAASLPALPLTLSSRHTDSSPHGLCKAASSPSRFTLYFVFYFSECNVDSYLHDSVLQQALSCFCQKMSQLPSDPSPQHNAVHSRHTKNADRTNVCLFLAVHAQSFLSKTFITELFIDNNFCGS